MEDFTIYGDYFPQALENLEKVLILCQESHLVLSSIKCKIIQTQGIVLGHHISHEGVKVERKKIEVISHIPFPTSQKEVRIFLGHAGYYRRFIKKFY